MLHFDVHGRLERDRRLVLVHGFTQTRRSWDPLVHSLGARHQVVAVDAPGHGLSSQFRVGLWEGARLLGEVGNEADYLGYSMGGRLVLHLALAAPYLVRRVVLIGATAGIEDPRERAARRAADEVLAAGLEKDGLEPFLRRWLAQPLFASLPAGAAALEARRENDVAGLAASLRLMGTGAQEPLWDRLGSLRMPALFVAGEGDTKFAGLARRLAAAWGGDARVEIVAGAGHAAHLESPEVFLGIVLPFLAEAHPRASPRASSAP